MTHPASDDHLQAFPPVFASNRHERGETVAREVNRLLAGMREALAEVPSVAIATAYINPAGMGLILDELHHAPRVRILLGAEPEPEPEHALLTGSPDQTERLDEALDRHTAWLAAERDLTGFTVEATQAAQRLVEWLRTTDDTGERRVEVRRYVNGFVHGKALVVEHPLLPAVLAGSSNYTRAGLSVNHELNLGYPSGSQGYVALVRDWFERLWEQSEPYALDDMYAARWEPHAPWVVFLRMLLELYRDTRSDDETPRTELPLTMFQADGVARMERLLDSLGGVLVADEVGLGKTFLAGEVIARTARRDRQRVAIVCPAALKKGMWEPFLDRWDFSRRVKVYSYDELRMRSEPDDPGHADFMDELDDCSLVVIDEAHNLRNPTAQRSAAVNALTGSSNPKNVVLLTATPVNNSLLDLHTLVSYFIRNDAQFARLGIPSIRGYIKAAQAQDPESLSPEHLFDLMDQVAVRRTRRFVKEQYSGETIKNAAGKDVVITFPTPRPRRLSYDLDEPGRRLLDAVVYALEIPGDQPLVSPYADRRDDPDRLMLARYTASAYAIDEPLESYQVANAGLLRSALLKRLESSPRALANTLKTIMRSHVAFLSALDHGYVLSGEALTDWTGSEAEDLTDWLAGLDDEALSQVVESGNYHADDLRHDVETDLHLLGRLRDLAEAADHADEAKAARLIRALEETAADARRMSDRGIPTADRRKVLVFSSFADTITDLHERVTRAVTNAPDGSPLTDFRGRIANPIKGQKTGIEQEARARTLGGFAPETAGPLDSEGRPRSENRYDILLTTDVLSEGVNLQQAGRIINYDLPWNPMRLVQRHGRIDRIGSKHDEVVLGCFFPNEHLDTLLSLEETLQRKLAYAQAAVGVGEVLPGQQPGRQLDFYDTREQIEKLYQENPELFEERGGNAAVSGEELRRRMARAFKESEDLQAAVEQLPYMSGSGFAGDRVRVPGYVFCMRMGAAPLPWFRWVPVDEAWVPVADPESGEAAVVDDTLVSLMNADPGGPLTPREVSDEAFAGAYAAWEAARSHAHRAWEALTDPKALAPEPPKAFKDAIALVMERGGPLMERDDLYDLIRRLNTRPPVRVEREVRTALNEHRHDPAAAITAVKAIVEEAGIQPYVAESALPHLHPDDIHLVAWMAVTPSGH